MPGLVTELAGALLDDDHKRAVNRCEFLFKLSLDDRPERVKLFQPLTAGFGLGS